MELVLNRAIGETAPASRQDGAETRFPYLTAGVAAASVLVAVIPAGGTGLELTRGALASGQLWRIVTCHLPHWSASHLLWDIVAFVVLGWLCEPRNRVSFALCLAASAVAIPAVVLFLRPEMAVYRGLSGIDSALFALATAQLMAEGLHEGRIGPVLLSGAAFTGFACKLGWEFVNGSPVFADFAGRAVVPVPEAHVAGLAVGIAVAISAKGLFSLMAAACEK